MDSLRTHRKKIMIALIIAAVLLLIAGQIAGVIAALLLLFFYNQALREGKKKTLEQTRLAKFAHDNGWQYTPKSQGIRRAGSLFENGAPCVIENHIVTPAFEVGRCIFTREHNEDESSSGPYAVRHFIGLFLPKKLPHLLVNAKNNKNQVIMQWLPHLSEKVRKLSLEGDFDRYFTLYSPRKYDTDARVIFAPDVMDALIKDARQYDMEIIGDRMYFYCDKIDWHDEDFWQRVNRLATIIEKEIGHQAIHYTDEHKGKELAVAQSGMGLGMKLRMPLWAKLWIGGIAAAALILLILQIVFSSS